MKIAICDDEKHYCKQIQECVEIYLDKHHIYGKTEIFMDGNALLERGMLAEFDALFLDVEFGGKAQGMKIAREVHQRNAMLPIVFVSLSFEKCKRFAERNRRKHGYRSFRVYAETKEKNISFSGGDRNAFTGSDYVY